ncbi:ubiquitin-like domain-containing protein CIP73 isoform X4 [Corylus avellana]|uniref:ubiquitin-like domain-containing protein CIP73 isoform X4 n=1 Tax=Corylus avellana TaxID=13451 RepID=UPI00286CD40F|nr:ubiquitin-like domain-containing protein CIP73 isoform X4 [Corylus avellana]
MDYVEDGHTLHLVVRQPVLPSSEGLSNHPAIDPALGTSRGQSNQVAPGLVIEAFSAVQGDSVPPEINRIVSAVLGSFGITNVLSGGEGIDVREHGTQNPTQLQSEQTGMRGPPDRSHSTFGLPPAVSLGPLQPPVIHDSLTTLSQYLSLMRHDFDAIVAGRSGGNSAQAAATHGNGERGPNSTLPTGTVQEGFPTPASLAEVMLSSRQMLIEHAGECILQLSRQLEDQVNVTDPSVRLSTQSSVRRAGFLIHNLGALLLELGRTTMTLRLGQTPSEAVVNAGPAVFISPTGPNPIMVQPLPFQPGTSLGAIPMGGVQPGSGLVNGLGTGFVPRRIDIQIRRGSSATTPNVSREEHSDTQPPSGLRNSTTNSGGENPIMTSTSRVSEGPSFGGESGVQVVPTRTMIAAVPGPFSRLPSDSAGNLIGLYYPVLGRFQHVASGLVSGEQGSQASGEHHSAGLQTEQQTNSAVQQHNIDGPARDGSFPTPYLRQQQPSNARSGNINILSADGTQNSQESDGHLPSSVMQFLRTLFPGGEIHVEEASSEGTGRGSVSEHEHVGTSGGFVNAPEAEPRASDEGIFLSNLLHQIIPLISPQAGSQPDARPTEAANASENTMPRDSSTQAEDSDVGTSRRPNDDETSPPNSKRQKME